MVWQVKTDRRPPRPMSVLKRHAVDLLGGLVLWSSWPPRCSRIRVVVQRTLLGKVDRAPPFPRSQLEREIRQAGRSGRPLLGRTDRGAPGAPAASVRHLLEPFPILLDGPEGEAVRRFPGNLDRLTWGQETLPELEAAILALDPADPASLARGGGGGGGRFATCSNAYHEPVTAIARNALQIDNYEARSSSWLKAHLKSLYLYIIVMVAGVLLLLLLRRGRSGGRAHSPRAGRRGGVGVASEGRGDRGLGRRHRPARPRVPVHLCECPPTPGSTAMPITVATESAGAGPRIKRAGRGGADERGGLRPRCRPMADIEGRPRAAGRMAAVFPMEAVDQSARLQQHRSGGARPDRTQGGRRRERAILREQRFRSQKLEAIGRLAGGNRARLQQHPGSDHRLCRLPHGGPAPRLGKPNIRGNIHTAEAPRQAAGHPDPDLQPPARLPAGPDGSRRRARGNRDDAWRATLPSTALLDLDLPEEPVFAQVDAGQIGQVVMNLCVNARERPRRAAGPNRRAAGTGDCGGCRGRRGAAQPDRILERGPGRPHPGTGRGADRGDPTEGAPCCASARSPPARRSPGSP